MTIRVCPSETWGLKREQSIQRGIKEALPSFLAFPPSVISDNGQSTQFAELGLRLPLPLFIGQPCLVDLTC